MVWLAGTVSTVVVTTIFLVGASATTGQNYYITLLYGAGEDIIVQFSGFRRGKVKLTKLGYAFDCLGGVGQCEEGLLENASETCW